MASVSSASSAYAGSNLVNPQPRLSFTLTDQDGAVFDFTAETAGQPTLLFFGYTHCPDICPTTMADISLALKDVPTSTRLRRAGSVPASGGSRCR
jgi:protein SCO1/2